MSQPSSLTYLGTELELMLEATQWKRLLAKQIAPFVRGRVLEVGGGIGGNRASFANDRVSTWTALEPDPELAARYRLRLAAAGLSGEVHTRVLGQADRCAYDSVIYADVLEHIKDDQKEVALALDALTVGGHLLIIVPAHPFLFSEMDQRIGHHRRYTRATLRALQPEHGREVRARYLDCVGILASLANRLALRQAAPTRRQILFWDRLLVPLSGVLDPLTGYRLGKSALIVWQRVADSKAEPT